MLDKEKSTQFGQIFTELAKELDITNAQHNSAVSRYEALGRWLGDSGSTLALYKPEILPQGSFLLGTTIKPINDTDDIDIDLVCKLNGKEPSWTQKDLKVKIGERIMEHSTYDSMLVRPDGKRCWTLKYADSANFHMDILPALAHETSPLLEKAYSAHLASIDEVAIRYTDKTSNDYDKETDDRHWPVTNPLGFARWFEERVRISRNLLKSKLLSEAVVSPVPSYTSNKPILKRVVQILKRHRDIMFNGDDEKPISIIITTLAAKAHDGESELMEALQNIIFKIPNLIDKRWDPNVGRNVDWVENPVKVTENFADKWPMNPKLRENFYRWVQQIQYDISDITGKSGLHTIKESVVRPFGKELVEKTFNNYAEFTRIERENKQLRMRLGSGVLGSSGVVVPPHTFFGND